MTRDEFLTELNQELATTGFYEFNREQIRYYRDYINGEMSKGRSEQDIMDELGDPRLIAKTIKNANGFDDERPVEFDSQGHPMDDTPEEEKTAFDKAADKVKRFEVTGAKAGWFFIGFWIILMLLIVGFFFLIGNLFAFSPLLVVLIIALFYKSIAGGR